MPPAACQRWVVGEDSGLNWLRPATPRSRVGKPARRQDIGGRMEKSKRELLSAYVWGFEPQNIEEITRQLKEMGVDLDAVIKEVDAVIKKHSGGLE